MPLLSDKRATNTHLDQILARTFVRVAHRKADADFAELERRAAAHTPRGFAAALRFQKAAGTWPAVIAELKKASPSKGVIRDVFKPAELARTLEAAGASALSILTDEEFFQGSLQNLEIASASTAIPCLRKDFMIDPFQMLEARAAGADAVLLIVAALSAADLKTLSQAAFALDLDVLCEVHDADELDRAVQLGCQLIGVNSRDLRTFAVDSAIQLELGVRIPKNVVSVAESGVRSRADMDQLLQAGYAAFLVGEALMRQPDPAAALAVMLGRSGNRE